jgi:2-isopropylmalate synthase
VDIVQVALNLYTQGISPNLDFSDLYSIIEIVTSCNEIPVHQRHPYAGELVFCAFSGSHQDAIKKGFAARKLRQDNYWEIPYLPIDPADLGCTYEAVIRVNSQSGKGGVSYIVQERLELDMPRKMQIAFYQVIQAVADRTSKEMSQEDIERIFRTTYHYGEGYQGRFVLLDYTLGRSPNADGQLSVQSPSGGANGFAAGVSPSGIAASNPAAKNRYLTAHILYGNKEMTISGVGNGPISALLDAIKSEFNIDLSVREFTEAAIGQGTDVRAGSYVELVSKSGKGSWGVGDSVDSTTAILQAVLSAINGDVLDAEELMDEVDGALAAPQATSINAIPILTK